MVRIPVSWGELFDKITILEIKGRRIEDAAKRANITRELEALQEVSRSQRDRGRELDRLVTKLRAVNETLWDIEDDIRACARSGDFSDRFIQLAGSVYVTMDQRAVLNLNINRLLGSELVLEMSYEAY